MSFENVLVVLALLAVGFINLVLPRLKRYLARAAETLRETAQAQARPASSAPPTGPAQPVPVDMQSPGPVRPGSRAASRPATSRSTSPADRAPEPPAATPLRATRRWQLDRRAARRGMVLRTILGPCRAQEPFEAHADR